LLKEWIYHDSALLKCQIKNKKYMKNGGMNKGRFFNQYDIAFMSISIMFIHNQILQMIYNMTNPHNLDF